MTPDEAVKKLTMLRDGCDKDEMQEYMAACNLGIEALKAIKLFRSGSDTKHFWKLPGETEN
ncbi:unnamed protein product [marine sediment metagenome]|uniref:Uncharacterized protein n=1 Tax=marine sediment metagenome TaxID=412755 RepID=X1VGJ2_9ZZZZ